MPPSLGDGVGVVTGVDDERNERIPSGRERDRDRLLSAGCSAATWGRSDEFRPLSELSLPFGGDVGVLGGGGGGAGEDERERGLNEGSANGVRSPMAGRGEKRRTCFVIERVSLVVKCGGDAERAQRLGPSRRGEGEGREGLTGAFG